MNNSLYGPFCLSVKRVESPIGINTRAGRKAAKNVNDYLAEQQMYLNVEVVEASGKYIVAIDG